MAVMRALLVVAATAVLLAAADAARAAGGTGGQDAGDRPAGRPTAADYPWDASARFEWVRLAVDDGPIPTVAFLSGVAVDPTWAVAVGVEYDRYDEANVVPLFLHLRVTPKGGEIGHLVFVEAGYSLFWIDGTSGTGGSGPFARGGMGRRIGRLLGSDVYASVSYRVQASEEYAERTGEEGSVLHQFAVAVGVGL
jgi:hypothetical protein